jgi:hypothetical protein
MGSFIFVLSLHIQILLHFAFSLIFGH